MKDVLENREKCERKPNKYTTKDEANTEKMTEVDISKTKATANSTESITKKTTENACGTGKGKIPGKD